MPQSKSRYIVAILALAFLPGDARSEKDEKTEDDQKQPALVETWLRRLDTAEERLRAGDYAKARDMAHGLERQMLDNIQGGPGAGALLARTLVVRSFAEAGLGRMRDAVWDWLMARSVYPELSDESLTRAGKVGRELLDAMTNPPGTSNPDETATSAPSQLENQGPKSGVTRPEKIRGGGPQYPYAVRQAGCVVGEVILESVIDEQGEVQRPAVLASPSPLLSLASLEALRTWRFKPAQFQGKPVKVYYTLTVNFSLTECRKARKREEG